MPIHRYKNMREYILKNAQIDNYIKFVVSTHNNNVDIIKLSASFKILNLISNQMLRYLSKKDIDILFGDI